MTYRPSSIALDLDVTLVTDVVVGQRRHKICLLVVVVVVASGTDPVPMFALVVKKFEKGPWPGSRDTLLLLTVECQIDREHLKLQT